MGKAFVWPRKIAVLGAGVMGAQVAALCANGATEVLLFDLTDGDGVGRAEKALENLGRIKPAALSLPEFSTRITACRYEDDLQRLGDCQLVIETVAETEQIKRQVYGDILPYLAPETVLATNTSGLSISSLGAYLPNDLRARFCGVHFFNPPRYQNLVELIPHPDTAPKLLDELETFLVGRLGKEVIRAYDTPAFIANRVGLFSVLTTLWHARRLGLRLDVVDDLTGPILGRPKSATIRAIDLVGLDTFAKVCSTVYAAALNDPWRDVFRVPDWMNVLIERGELGQKTKSGLYRKKKEGLWILDVDTGRHVPAGQRAGAEVKEILRDSDPARRLRKLKSCGLVEAEFVWSILRDTWHYSAYHLAEISPSAREVDIAMRSGFGWDLGPFELWQECGWGEVHAAIESDRGEGETLADAPFPGWVTEVSAVHAEEGSYSPGRDEYVPRSELPIYSHQLMPARLVGERPCDIGSIVLEVSDAFVVREGAEDVLVASWRTRNGAIDGTVLDGLNRAMDMAEREGCALVLWPEQANFSVGADLKELVQYVEAGRFDAIEARVKAFQKTCRRIKYCSMPVIAAIRGYVLGGGCEIAMHAASVVAYVESYVGLTEVGVGLLPAGGGCTEMVQRASGIPGLPLTVLEKPFMQIAFGQVATSAEEAKAMGYLNSGHHVTLQQHDLLYLALQQARLLLEAGYQPPLKRPIRLGGEHVASTVRAELANRLEGGFISDHDARIAGRIADVMAGAPLPEGSLVDEEWLLKQEADAFMELVQTPETAARLRYMLENGKPLRN